MEKCNGEHKSCEDIINCKDCANFLGKMGNTMNTYKISYTFDGHGEVEIQAKSEKQAEKIWRSGEFENEDEWGEYSFLENVEEISG